MQPAERLNTHPAELYDDKLLHMLALQQTTEFAAHCCITVSH